MNLYSNHLYHQERAAFILFFGRKRYINVQEIHFSQYSRNYQNLFIVLSNIKL